MVVDNEEHLSLLLKQSIQQSGAVEKGIDAFVAERGISKRVVESMACGLGVLPDKYQRNLGTIGYEGQRRILLAKVTVVGLGGLGGYVVEQLARCGTGRIIGVDEDHFDQTNLNRQLLAERSSIGLNKTEVAQRRVSAINDAVEFHPFTSKVENLDKAVYDDVDVIFDCLDVIPSKLYLQDVGERLDIPVVHGAIGGWYGQVAVVWPGSQLLRVLYGEKREGIERELGNPPFTPAVIAGLMVAEGIKVLLGKKERENGLFMIDLLSNQWEYLTI
jgi:molybdopterin/thiamine biosynthesis adenylyltransferase